MNPLPDAAWAAWHPDELARRLTGAAAKWYVVGGWALDLWHGRQTRDHEDLEFAVLRQDIGEIRTLLSDLDFFAADAGRMTHLDRSAAPPESAEQFWGADRDAGCWRVDMMAERGEPDIWHYKRDPLHQLPRASAVLCSANGIRFLAPEIVLLFKAKHHRTKDEADFQTALPRLSTQQKADLRGWLDKFHPGHAWIARL